MAGYMLRMTASAEGRNDATGGKEKKRRRKRKDMSKMKVRKSQICHMATFLTQFRHSHKSLFYILFVLNYNDFTVYLTVNLLYCILFIAYSTWILELRKFVL